MLYLFILYINNESDYYFDVYESLNDFIKLDENRLVFIYTSSFNDEPLTERRVLYIQESWKLCIIIIDLNQKSPYLINNFYIDLGRFVPKMKIFCTVRDATKTLMMSASSSAGSDRRSSLPCRTTPSPPPPS